MLLVVFVLGLMSALAQTNSTQIKGEVSYISGESIYVKFASTNGIENGDTLLIQNQEFLEPALIVQHHSSISCLCKSIGLRSFKVSDIIIKRIKFQKKEAQEETREEDIENDLSQQVIAENKNKVKKSSRTNKFQGKLSLSSYSNISNSSNNIHRFRYTFSMNSENISDSKFSAETYVSFTHKLNQWDIVQENLNNALKIYNLALKYDFNETASVLVGRKINPKIANVGAIDGLQFQKQFKQFFAGGVVGSRPDYQDYGFNPDLLEYGAYIGQDSKTDNGYFQSSLAFFEQRNKGNIDRRFIYFQHSNSFIKKVNMFSSFELDLYKVENGKPMNTLSLTSLYLSLNYRLSRKVSLFASYDNRRNVIYYETFKNYADQILQMANRQGLRVRATFRPIKYLNIGINGGTRFRKEDPRPTNTLHAYTTYTNLPLINASLTFSGNITQTSYLDGLVYGARLTKNFFNGKLYSILNYRRVHFDYVNTSSKLNQNIAEIEFSYQINKKLYFSTNYELTLQKKQNFNRVYVNLRKKF